MTPSIRRKLQALAERHEELGLLLAQPDVAADAERFRDMSREYAHLEPLTAALRAHEEAERELDGARAMLDDPELGREAAEEVRTLQSRLE